MVVQAVPLHRTRRATLARVAALMWLVAGPAWAGTESPDAAEAGTASVSEPIAASAAPGFPAREAVRALIEREVAGTKLPADIAEAVVFVESRYDSSVIGSVGEIGLMQVRPETAAMLGFKGDAAELTKPDINIHYGVIYLAKAWRLAGGDLCRALMKYRAGHGEETMTARSAIYCNRARNRLIAVNSPFAAAGATAALQPEPPVVAVSPAPSPSAKRASPARPADVYVRYKQGTASASRAYWAAHEARIRAINARIETKWRRVASR